MGGNWRTFLLLSGVQKAQSAENFCFLMDGCNGMDDVPDKENIATGVLSLSI